MKVKKIKLELTTGKTIEIDSPGKGFIVTEKGIQPTADWSMNEAYLFAAELLMSTMAAQVGNYGTFKPLFDKLEETVSNVEKQLSPETWSKEFAYKYQQAFLIDEVMQDAKLPEDKRKYKELYDKMIKFTTKAAEKLNDSADKKKLS